LSKSTKRSHELQRVITAKDNIIADVRNKLDDAVASNRQMEEMLKLKNNELERMAHDLNAVTRESQVLSNESYKLASELRENKTKLNGLIQNNSRLDQVRRSADLEKADLLQTYRTVVEERYALEQGNEEIKRSREVLHQQMVTLQEEKNQLSSRLFELEEELRRKSARINSFERQLDSISRKNLSLQRNLEAAEAEINRLKSDLYASRESTKQISQQTQSLQMNIANVEEEHTIARSKLHTTSKERDALQKLLAEERQRANNLEMLIASLRAKDAANTHQVRKMADENAALRTKLNEAKYRLANTQHIFTLRGNKCSASDSSEEVSNVSILTKDFKNKRASTPCNISTQEAIQNASLHTALEHTGKIFENLQDKTTYQSPINLSSSCERRCDDKEDDISPNCTKGEVSLLDYLDSPSNQPNPTRCDS